MARDRAGHVNRAFRGLKLSQPAVAGSKLFAADGKEVGIVTSAVESPRLGPIGLGYVRRGNKEAGTKLTIGPDAGGIFAVVSELPMSA